MIYALLFKKNDSKTAAKKRSLLPRMFTIQAKQKGDPGKDESGRCAGREVFSSANQLTSWVGRSPFLQSGC